ncbi:hypothetical protein ACJ73_06584, partial [Blastomyces percursus]
MTWNLSVKIEKHHSSEVTLSPQSGPRPTGPPQPVPEPEPKTVTEASAALVVARRMLNHHRRSPISSALLDNISEDGSLKETHARVGDSSASHLEPATSGPISCYISEDDIAKAHPDQLKQYKERLDVGPARRAFQARERARSPFPEPRRSSHRKKPRQ